MAIENQIQEREEILVFLKRLSYSTPPDFTYLKKSTEKYTEKHVNIFIRWLEEDSIEFTLEDLNLCQEIKKFKNYLQNLKGEVPPKKFFSAIITLYFMKKYLS